MYARSKPWRWGLAGLTAISLLAGTATSAASAPPPISGTHKWAIVLCNFSNHTAQPYSLSYYQQMFEGTGTSQYDFQHYWSDNSYGNLSVAGTKVTGWHTLGITRDAWEALGRGGKRQACGDKAEQDGFSFAGYYGFVTIFPEVKTTLISAINASATTLTVASANSGNEDLFPTPPFVMSIDDRSLPNGGNSEIVNVTGISGTTFTVVRGAGGSTAKSHGAAADIGVPGDIFGAGPGSWTLNGHPYTLASAVLPSDVNMTGAAHETGHGFGYNHSRKLSTSTTDYADCFDIMSAYDTCSFTATYGGSNLGSANAAAGPGITSINLNSQGWLPTGPGSRVYDLTTTPCNQTTLDMSALNHADVAGTLAARIPATLSFPGPSSTTVTSDYYWLEYREANGWDSGLPGSGIVLHVHGTDGYAYWVDTATTKGWLNTGDEYVNAAQKTYVAVSSVNTSTHKSRVTIAGCKIGTSATYSGATSGDYHDFVTLAGDLKVNPSGAPIPNQTLTLSLGSQSCSPKTDANGHASCSLQITQPAGVQSATASFTGDSAYNSAASTGASFTINHEETTLSYTGGPFIANHRSTLLSAVLTEDGTSAPVPAGQSVTLTLGSGGSAQSCTGTTLAGGTVSCTIAVVNQPYGNQPVSALFSGDAYYSTSSDLQTRLVFGFADGGPFVVSSHAVSPVTFWSPGWALSNPGMPWEPAFLGYAAQQPGAADPTCGVNWTYLASVRGMKPPLTVPSYMAVVVTSHMTRLLRLVTGDVSKIVIVKVDPGYNGTIGHTGTGQIVATICG